MKDITEHELQNLQGGVLWIFGVAGGALIGATINGWPDFKQGFNDAFWHQQRLAEK